MPVNQRIYHFYAPVYDRLFDRMYRSGRRRAIELLDLLPGERLLIPGVGTGLDLPAIPPGVCVTAIDISPEMLRQAQAKLETQTSGVVEAPTSFDKLRTPEEKRAERRCSLAAVEAPVPHQTELRLMDAQALEFPDSSFDAVLMNLIISVVPDPRLAFSEAWRVLHPGGRLAIFDKFLPENSRLSPARRLVGRIISLVGTDPNRRLSDIIDSVSGITIARDEPRLLNGQYRTLLLKK